MIGYNEVDARDERVLARRIYRLSQNPEFKDLMQILEGSAKSHRTPVAKSFDSLIEQVSSTNARSAIESVIERIEYLVSDGAEIVELDNLDKGESDGTKGNRPKRRRA